jgi:hypothetical protein
MSGIDTNSAWGPAVIVPQVRDSFLSGGNAVYSFGRYVYRKFASGPTDRDFDHIAFIDEHNVPYEQQSWFIGTKNELEANWLMEDIADTEYRQRLLRARGDYSANLAWWISSGLGPLVIFLALLAVQRFGKVGAPNAATD